MTFFILKNTRTKNNKINFRKNHLKNQKYSIAILYIFHIFKDFKIYSRTHL